MKRFATRVAVFWGVLSVCLALTAMSCEGEAKKGDEKAPGEAGGAAKPGPQEPEEELLAAMKEVAQILSDNKDDVEAAIATARKYAEANEARLTRVVEDLRTKVDAMAPEAQDAFWEKNTAREEYQLWDGAMRRFEDTYPDKYAELEEITNTIQSAGTEDLIEEEQVKVDARARYDEAEAEYQKLVAMTLDGVTAEAVEKRFGELATQAALVDGLYQSVFQNTDDTALAIEAQVKAADLYLQMARKIRDVAAVEGFGAADLEAARAAAATPLEVRARELYATALKSAAEKGIDNETVARVKTLSAELAGADAPPATP